MPQSILSKHFSKVGLAEIGIDEVSIQHLRMKLKISAISISSIADMDVRTPKARKKMNQVKRHQRGQSRFRLAASVKQQRDSESVS
eukprot:1835003-Amphidinium_carterae.1